MKGQLTCICTKVRTDDDKVDHCIDPSNDKKTYGEPEEPNDSYGQSQGQGMKKMHKSKLDKIYGSPIERGENESPLGDVQDCRNVFSEWYCRALVHGFNKIKSVQKLMAAGKRDCQAYAR